MARSSIGWKRSATTNTVNRTTSDNAVSSDIVANDGAYLDLAQRPPSCPRLKDGENNDQMVERGTAPDR